MYVELFYYYYYYYLLLLFIREGQWPSGRVDFSEPGGPRFNSSSRQPKVVAHQH